MKKIVVVCAGSHAAVVIESISLSRLGKVVCLLDDEESKRGTRVLNVPVVGGTSDFAVHQAAYGFDSAVIGMANYSRRAEQRSVFQDLRDRGLAMLTVVHPSAFVSPTARLGVGVFVGPGVIVHTCAEVGDNVVLNTGCSVDHDARIGDHVFVSPGAVLAGHVTLGQGAYIGPGAVVASRVRVGEYAVIGGGSCVLQDVSARAKVYGLPAKPRDA